MVDTNCEILSTIFIPITSIYKQFNHINMKYLSSIFIIFLSTSLFSQSLTDAVRYSDLQTIGTARTAGVGGSFGAMGGDFGSLLINPAGMGDFYKSEFNFGFALNRINNTSRVVRPNSIMGSNGTRIDDTNFNISNIGFVIHRKPRASSLLTSNFSIGMTQTKNLSEEFNYSAATVGSITERFVEVANGNGLNELDPFEGGVAYDAGAIFDSDSDLNYETDIYDTTTVVLKNQFVERSGKMNEFSLGWAGNIANVVNVGVVGSIPFVSFEEIKTYKENMGPDAGSINPFNRLEYVESLSTSGFGLNIKAGATAKLGKQVRVGLAYHSPSWLRLQDDYYTEMQYEYFNTSDQNVTLNSESPDGRFNYLLKTTSRFVASAGTLFSFGDFKGFVNADAEFQNYKAANFDFTINDNSPSTIDYQQEVNDDIRGELTNALSLRLGAELAYKKFRVRVGFNGQGSPYLIDDNEFVRKTITGGLGFRGDRFYIDFAAFSFSDVEGYYPYLVLTDGRNQLVNKNQNNFKAMFTCGYKI